MRVKKKLLIDIMHYLGVIIMCKERNLYIDILKAITIILVIVGHCIQYGSGLEYSYGSFFNHPVFILIYSFHMPLFMLISGFLFSFSVKKRKWDELLLIRIKQLIIPLFSWSVVSLGIDIYKVLAGNLSDSITVIWIIKKLISGFLYGPWFLWAVWWCSFVIIIVRRFLNDSIIIYILGCLISFIIPDIQNLALYKFMFPFFLMAYIFNSHDYKNKWKKVYLNKIFILGISFFFGVLLFFYDYDKYIYISGYSILNKNAIRQICINIFRFTVGTAGSITVMYIIYIITKFLPDRINYLLAYIGKNTLGIYIISGYLIVEILGQVTSFLNGVNYFYLVGETLCVLCVSIIINNLLKKYKVTNCLFLGGR